MCLFFIHDTGYSYFSYISFQYKLQWNSEHTSVWPAGPAGGEPAPSEWGLPGEADQRAEERDRPA